MASLRFTAVAGQLNTPESAARKTNASLETRP
jgi:hypothetical protein